MATKVLPILGGEGWLKDPNLIMDRLYMHVFLTDHSQSNIYQGDVVSLQYILSLYGDDELSITTAVQKSLKSLYNKYFKNVSVGFKSIDPSAVGEPESILVFSLSITGDLDGKSYELSKIIKADKSATMKRFIDGL